MSIGDRADVEAPSFGINPTTGALVEPRDVRLTMRDVILARTDNGLRVTGEGDRVFAHNLVVPLLGRQLEFDRGFQWVDVRLGSERFRFVNSHFEAFSSDLALAQAAEVVQAMPTDRTVVFVCDCNSDPLDESVKPVDTQPHKAAYDLITGRRRLHRPVAGVGAGRGGLDLRPLRARQGHQRRRVRPPHRHGLRPDRVW